MKCNRLTSDAMAAKPYSMEKTRRNMWMRWKFGDAIAQNRFRDAAKPRGRAVIASGAVVAMGLLASACVTVNAPDEPIVIELNINIKQEVIYRLAADANKTIEENEDIF